jgi:hypothetical protein
VASILTSTYSNKERHLAAKSLNGQKMDSIAEGVNSVANVLAVIAVFGGLFAGVVETNNPRMSAAAPILAAAGVIIFLVGNVLRYVFASI